MTEFVNTPERTRLDVDPDVRHLLELLSLLPWPVMRVTGKELPSAVHEGGADFWSAYAEQSPPRWDASYYVEKLSSWPAMMVEPGRGSDEDVRRLSEYCLLFFEQEVRESPGRVALLDRHLSGAGTTAHRWLDDICATAWRLYAPREAHHGLRGLASEIAVAGRTDLIPPPSADRTLLFHDHAEAYNLPQLP